MNNERFSDTAWLGRWLRCIGEISGLLETHENDGRDALIRVLEHAKF